MWEFYGWHLWMHGIAYLAKAPSATRAAAAASHGTTPTRESICTSSSCKRTWIVPWIFHSPDFLTRSQSEVAIMMLHCLSKSFEPLLNSLWSPMDHLLRQTSKCQLGCSHKKWDLRNFFVTEFEIFVNSSFYEVKYQIPEWFELKHPLKLTYNTVKYFVKSL